MENLTDLGYFVEEKPFDLDQCTSLLKTMAGLHTSSIAYEENKSKNGSIYRLCEEFKAELEGSSFNFNEGHPRKKWTENSMKAIADCFLLLPGRKNRHAVVENLWNFYHKNLPEHIKPSNTFRNVIIHDDLWCNNIMMRNLPGGKIESVMVDFQMVRCAPPAFGLLTFLYLNLEKNLLRANKEKLEDKYYEFFCNNMEEHKIDPKSIMSKVTFKESLQAYKLTALLQAAVFGTLSFISSSLSNTIISNEGVFEEFAFTDRSKYLTKEFKENSNFRKRFCDILLPLAEFLLRQ